MPTQLAFPDNQNGARDRSTMAKPGRFHVAFGFAAVREPAMTEDQSDPFESDDAAELLRRAFERLGPEVRPLLAAALARTTAERYRQWAASPGSRRYRWRLLACAERSEEIARAVEAAHRGGAIERRILEHPDMARAESAAFGGRPMAEQFVVQARRSRLCAERWRAFAAEERDPARKRVYAACAELEEINGVVLAVTLRGGPSRNPTENEI